MVREEVTAAAAAATDTPPTPAAAEERSFEANLRWARSARAAASAGVRVGISDSSSIREEQSLPEGEDGVESTSADSFISGEEGEEEEPGSTTV